MTFKLRPLQASLSEVGPSLQPELSLWTEQQTLTRKPQTAASTAHPPLRTDSTVLPPTHLRQDILALPGKHVLEPIKGDVVGHAKHGARGVTHMFRAVPLPVPTDAGNSNGKDGGREGWVL